MLKQPYPFLYSSKRNFIIILLIGFAVFLINYFINEDQIVKQHFYVDQLTFSLAFGLITGLLIFIVLELLPRIFLTEALKENWTLSKEFALISCLFTLIIICNYFFLLFSARDFQHFFKVEAFINIAFQGLLIGFIPALIAILFNYTFFLRKNLNESRIYNEQLLKKLSSKKTGRTEKEIRIPSDNKNETICFIPTQLWFIKSEGNYVELFFEDENSVRKEIYRTSIKKIEEALHEYPQIMRVHRCYIANLQNVKNCRGNARNFQLYFDNSKITVPVSRNKFQEIKMSIDVS